METPSGEVAYPTLTQIVDVNRQMVTTFGGLFLPPDNLRNKGSLEYILCAISVPIMGRQLFPSLKKKAAALAHEIITAHVFHDGNKRTGIHMAWEFLNANTVQVWLDDTSETLAIRIADGAATREDLFEWLHDHQ